MEVDEALMKLGAIGKWQIVYYTILSTAVMFPAAFHAIIIVYIGYKPEHRCKLMQDTNESDWKFSNFSSSCEMPLNAANETESQPCTDGWIYNMQRGSNIVTEWDLVCSKSYYAETSQTFYVLGVLIGAAIFSPLSDRFGRRRVFFLIHPVLMMVGICTAFVNNVYVFFFFRLLTGALNQGATLAGYVLASELFAAKYRTFAGIMLNNFWALAWSIFPLIAYLIPNWRHLQLFDSLIFFLVLPLIWLLPESVPWLYAKNRVAEAEEILRKAAKMNHIQMPQQILKRHVNADYLTVEPNKEANEIMLKNQTTKTKYTIIDLIKSKRLRGYALIMSLLWIICSLVYYGLSLSTAKLAGDRYLNGFLNAIVEIPAYVSSYLIVNRFGRRRPLIGYFLITSISLIMTQLISKAIVNDEILVPVIVSLNMLGKFGVTASYGIIYLVTQEIFPTTLRSQSVGIASVTGRTGQAVATFTSYIIEIVPWLPGLLFGILSAVGSLLVLLLPETLNRPLPLTIEDIEAWYEKPDKNKQQLTALNI